MPKLRVKISEKELEQLKNGEVVNIGKFAGIDLVELEVEKSEQEMILSIGKGGIRMENSSGESLHLYDYLKTIPNVKKGDIAFNQSGYYKFDGNNWNKIILGDLDG